MPSGSGGAVDLSLAAGAAFAGTRPSSLRWVTGRANPGEHPACRPSADTGA